MSFISYQTGHQDDQDKTEPRAAALRLSYCSIISLISAFEKTYCKKNTRMGNCLIKKLVPKETVVGTVYGQPIKVPTQQGAQDLNNQLSCCQKCKLFFFCFQNRNLFN